jgi:fatty-acid desaturase
MLSRSFKEKLFFLIIIVSFFYALVDIITTGNWYMLLVIYVIASINGLMGINIGCHRYFSHGGFETKPWKEKLLAFWCILAGHSTGPIAFTGIHGHHHKYSDTEHDVHSPITRPWWYIASGLVFLDFNRDRITWSREARKLFAKPYLKWIEHNYFRIWTGIIAMAYLIGGLDLVIYGFLAPAGYWVLQGSALIIAWGIVQKFLVVTQTLTTQITVPTTNLSTGSPGEKGFRTIITVIHVNIIMPCGQENLIQQRGLLKRYLLNQNYHN